MKSASEGSDIEAADPATLSLFSNVHTASLTSSHPDLSKVVKSWYQVYKHSQDSALEQLLDFVLRSSGLPAGSVTSEDLGREATKDTLARLEGMAGDIQNYPLMSGQKHLKNFFVDFQYFWVHMIGEGSDYLYDGVVLDFIVNWLCALSHSKFRPIRHTSTAALFAIGQALTDVLTHEERNFDRLQTFIDSETGNTRIARLRTQQTEVKEKVAALRTVIDSLVGDVLSYRCKDVMVEIRSLCAQYLGTLMSKCPASYINEKTMGFLSLMLYDKSGDVREHVLEYLLKLYAGGEENGRLMQQFTEKQRLRLVEMCHDIEPKCCVRALKICSELCKQGKLQKDEKDLLSCLLWVEEEDVRKAAADFTSTWLFQPVAPNKPEEVLDQGRHLDSETTLLAFVRFFKDYGCGLSFRVKLMVQGFWDREEDIKRWEVYCDLLQRGGRENATGLSPPDAVILLQMLQAALEILGEGEKYTNKTRFADLSGVIFERAMHILPLCETPQLLQAFAQVISALDLTPISSKDIRGSVLTLVEDLKQLFQRHSDPDLLQSIARCFEHLCNHPHPLQKETKEVLIKTVDEVSESFKAQLQRYILEDEEEGCLEVTVARVAALCSVQDLVDEIGQEGLEGICSLVGRYRSEVLKSPGHACSALKVLFFYHLWRLHRITLQPVDLTSYIQLRNTVIEEIAATVQTRTAATKVRDTAFTLLCETFMVSGGQAAEGQPVYFAIEGQLIRVLCDFANEIEVRGEVPEHLRPPKAFVKLSVKCEPPTPDADSRAIDLIYNLSRIICNCPSVTLSQLPSLYIALFGNSPLKSVFAQVKQVISYLRNRDATQAGPFRDKQVYFSIILDSLIRAAEQRQHEPLQELAKRLAGLQGVGLFKPRQAAGLREMIVEGVKFAVASQDNVFFLDAMTAFLTKGFLSPKHIAEIWENVRKELETTKVKIEKEAPGKMDVLDDLKNFQLLMQKLVVII